MAPIFRNRTESNRHINQLFLIAMSVKLAIPMVAILFCVAGISDSVMACAGLEYLSPENFFGVYSNADSGWYTRIIEFGYGGVPADVSAFYSVPNQHYAFFPLFPYAVRFIMLSGLSIHAAAFILNVICLYFLIRVFYLFLLNCGFKALHAYRTVLLFFLWPFSLHLYFVYTESVFLLLLLSGFLCIARQNWLGFSVVSALLVLCRPNGLLMVIPYGLYMLESRSSLNLKGVMYAFRQPVYYILMVMPLVFLAWMMMQYKLSGDFFTFSKAQAGWDKQWMFPLLALFRTGFWQDQFASVYTVAVMLISVFQIRKWPLSFTVLVWINLLLPMSAGSVVSMTRYISVLFPVFMWLSSALGDKTRPYRILTALIIIGQFICLYLWLESSRLMY